MHLFIVMAASNGFFTVVDEVLVGRARRGDPKALETIYRLFGQAVFTLARRICLSTSVAEDVTQETFLQAYRSLPDFRGDGAFGAWLRRITVSKALTAMRTNRRLARELTGTIPGDAETMPATPTSCSEQGWQRVDLERALVSLPESARVVVWLYDVEGMSHQEIAELFGRSVSFSKSRLARAHQSLRVWLQANGGIGAPSESRRTAGTARR
jgi:RNA polymerase sigma-70 factor (ECF subfamily)